MGIPHALQRRAVVVEKQKRIAGVSKPPDTQNHVSLQRLNVINARRAQAAPSWGVPDDHNAALRSSLKWRFYTKYRTNWSPEIQSRYFRPSIISLPSVPFPELPKDRSGCAGDSAMDSSRLNLKDNGQQEPENCR
jgi:hypothetical protein